MCILKCVKCFSNNHYTEESQEFNEHKKYRSRVMTSAASQPFCKKCFINIGCFDGQKKTLKTIQEKNFTVHI